MKTLILLNNTKEIVSISDTYDENENYYIVDNNNYFPKNSCDLVQVDSVPDYVVINDYCYIDGEFVINMNEEEELEPTPEEEEE